MSRRRLRVVARYEPEDLVPLKAVAEELGVSQQQLKDQAKRDEFPELLRVHSRHYLVRAQDFADWKAGRWTRAEVAIAQMKVEAVKALQRQRIARERQESQA